jgi:biopolymer transport protein ExbB
MMILLQLTADPATTTTIAQESVSVFDLAVKGGLMMIPLALMWIGAIYLFIERLLTINKANIEAEPFMAKVKELVLKNDITGAKMLCAQSGTPVARMIEKGISRIGSPLKNIEASIENVGKLEIFKLEKNLSTLATIAGAAPMIGFLGTVMGMISSFMAIAQQEGAIGPKILADGIYVAMITTVAGLIVGILAYLAYNYLVTRVAKIIHKMEYTTIDFIDLLQEPK